MTTQGYVRQPGEGESYWAVGAKGTIKGPNVYELENPPGWEVPLHVHDAEDEVHYYLEGEVVVTCGDDTFKAEPGALAFLPKGVPHALKFGETSRGRWLWISPENRDDLFREAGVPTSEPEPAEEEIDLERVFAVFEKNGMRFLEEEGHRVAFPRGGRTLSGVSSRRKDIEWPAPAMPGVVRGQEGTVSGSRTQPGASPEEEFANIERPARNRRKGR